MPYFLHIHAKDESGNQVKADDAIKGNTYYCPVCKQEFILKKSQRVGKGTRRTHFAHKVLSPNCKPESVLHYLFKNSLADKLTLYIETKSPLSFSWNCSFCNRVHSGNLLKKIKLVKVEHNLIVCQPDISLLGNNNEVFAVIEIVVTHSPEEKALRFYNDNDIILIQINLTSDDDLDEVESKISKPNEVNICFNPKCRVCGHYQSVKVMTIIDGTCKKCSRIVKIAKISNSNGGLIRGSNNLNAYSFRSEEIAFAKSKGVMLNSQLKTTCKKCGWYIDDFHVFTDYIFPAELGEFSSEKFDMGYHCDYCNGYE